MVLSFPKNVAQWIFACKKIGADTAENGPTSQTSGKMFATFWQILELLPICYSAHTDWICLYEKAHEVATDIIDEEVPREEQQQQQQQVR